jgi:hypothetical protein
MEEKGGNREFKTFRVKELHPTFGAEIEGVNFPNPSDEQFQEILAAMAKVRLAAGLPIILHEWLPRTNTVVRAG